MLGISTLRDSALVHARRCRANLPAEAVCKGQMCLMVAPNRSYLDTVAEEESPIGLPFLLHLQRTVTIFCLMWYEW